MSGAILTLNAGSSSLKFCLFKAAGEELTVSAHGQIEGVGTAPHLIATAADGAVAEHRWDAGSRLSHEDLLGGLLDWVEARLNGGELAAVGHRIVHGGADFRQPVVIDDAVLARLEALVPLAPLHQPHNLAPVRALMRSHPGLPQVACFDTAFHHGHAPVVDRFGLPRRWEAAGVRRYGFHGLSYEYVAGRMRVLDPPLAQGRMIVAHLGAGASLCAMRAGRSIDTTMGFSALDGLLMSTRCGALDPGVMLHLLQQHGLAAEEVEAMLYRQSGLLGVSGISGDMRVLLDSSDARAKEAVELFVFRIVREIGALAASLGGLDGLVFTGGVGEHAAPVREAVCEALAWLGFALDPAANLGGGRISAAGAKPVWAIATDEERMIAVHTRAVMRTPAL
jgi:acetate kinase